MTSTRTFALVIILTAALMLLRLDTVAARCDPALSACATFIAAVAFAILFRGPYNGSR